MHIALGLVEVQHGIIPGHAALLQHVLGCSFEVTDKALVGHDQHMPWKDGLPVLTHLVYSQDLLRYICIQLCLHSTMSATMSAFSTAASL